MSYETRVLNIFETLLKENPIPPRELERACKKFDKQMHEKVKNIFIMLDLLTVYSLQNLDLNVPEFQLLQKMLRFTLYPLFLSPAKFDFFKIEQEYLENSLDAFKDKLDEHRYYHLAD